MNNLKSFKLYEQFSQSISKIHLSKTDLVVPKLCFGTHPFNRYGLTYYQGSNILKYAYTRGLNFWDSSDDYNTHLHISEALKEIPKNDIVISSKITEIFDKSKVHNYIMNMLYELNINVIDIIFLHAIDNKTDYQKYIDIIPEIKNTPIKNIGASTHNPEIFDKISENNDIDVVMAPLNFKGKIDVDGYNPDNEEDYRDKMAEIFKKSKSNGKDTIAIKIFGRGKINEKEEAIKFISNQDYIDIFNIGMETIEQVNENINILNKYII